MADPVLVVEDLTVSYDGHVALADVSFTARAGTAMAVIGPNGSGKSTLLHAIAGLVPVRTGRIDVHGDDTALVLQSTDVDAAVPITVRDCVAMARYANRGLLGRFRTEDHEAIESAMERLDVTHLARRQLHDLSGGQRQRVLVAQGIAQDAAVLLLDEPINGLDLPSQERILEVVADERRAGRTVLMTTHSLEDARRCDRVLLLATRAIAVGPPDEVVSAEHLRAAFGGRVLALEDDFVVDDPHHVH